MMLMTRNICIIVIIEHERRYQVLETMAMLMWSVSLYDWLIHQWSMERQNQPLSKCTTDKCCWESWKMLYLEMYFFTFTDFTYFKKARKSLWILCSHVLYSCSCVVPEYVLQLIFCEQKKVQNVCFKDKIFMLNACFTQNVK